jgi:hypothetical protein
MSLQDELTAARRCLDDLTRTVARLEQRLAEQSEQGGRSGQEAETQAPARAVHLVSIPDTPYNHALWTDSDDEGVGVSYRRP